PEAVRGRVCPAGDVSLRAPGHRAVLSAMHLLPGPLVAAGAGARRDGSPVTASAAAVVEALGDDVAVVVDDGPSPADRPATVVRVDGGSWSVLREGALAAEDVGRQTTCLVVFVCTGNTCRSPLAEGLFKRKLADRLGCAPEELPGRGFLVTSAGVAA